MNHTGMKERWKIKIVSVMAILASMTAMGSYGYHVYSLFRDAQRQMPQPQIEKLVKDLRTYKKLTGRFPQNFKEINASGIPPRRLNMARKADRPA